MRSFEKKSLLKNKILVRHGRISKEGTLHIITVSQKDCWLYNMVQINYPSEVKGIKDY